MKILILALLSIVTTPASAVTTNPDKSKSYSCEDLGMLRARINKEEKLPDASVAAQLIRSLAKHSGECLKTVHSSKDNVEVQYLDLTDVARDAFSFSRNNLLVSWTRTFKSGKRISPLLSP